MSKHVRTLLAILGIAALMVSVVAVMSPKATTAANLTGGTYTYLIDGEEVTFTFDPVVRKDGLLLPMELFQRFGINVATDSTKNIKLSKGSVNVGMTLGANTMDIDGLVKTVTTPPIRLNGRIFLPSDPLREFGVDFSQDGNYVVMRNFTYVTPEPRQLPDGDYNSLKANHTIVTSTKADSGAFLQTEFTLLTPDLLNAANLRISYGDRARLTGLLQTNTLVLTKLSNLSNKAGGLVTTGISLVDDSRGQYDVQNVLDIGAGLLSNHLAPGGDRIGVLVFPKVSATALNLSLYYDNNQATLGAFPMLH